MKYLFIGAHPDDLELSCGGVIRKFFQNYHTTHVNIQSICGIKDELIASTAVMFDLTLSDSEILHKYNGDEIPVREFVAHRQEILNRYISLRDEEQPDVVFTHCINDIHQDHRVVAEECRRAFKNCTLVAYCHPWNGNQDSNYFIEITEEELQIKLKALSCYKSQSHRTYMNPDFIRAQAIYNGIKCGRKYAEAFRIEKLIA